MAYSLRASVTGRSRGCKDAFRLMQLPLGVFGVAIATVTLPVISRSAAAGNMSEFRVILARGMRLAFLLTVPSAIGLMLLADPIISVTFRARPLHPVHDAADRCCPATLRDWTSLRMRA
jgi:hypothetical protein